MILLTTAERNTPEDQRTGPDRTVRSIYVAEEMYVHPAIKEHMPHGAEEVELSLRAVKPRADRPAASP